MVWLAGKARSYNDSWSPASNKSIFDILPELCVSTRFALMSRSNSTVKLSTPMPRIRPILLLLISLLAASTLLTSGCGQKGDLYLPDRADSQK